MNPQNAAALTMAAARSNPANLASIFEQFYAYTLSAALSVAQGKTQSANVTLQADYPFACYSLAILIYDASTSAVILPANSTATVNINDTGAGANWFSNPVGVSSVFGTAQLPYVLPVFRIIQKTATLSFSFTNLIDGSVAADGATYLPVLLGAKMTGKSQSGQGIYG